MLVLEVVVAAVVVGLPPGGFMPQRTQRSTIASSSGNGDMPAGLGMALPPPGTARRLHRIHDRATSSAAYGSPEAFL